MSCGRRNRMQHTTALVRQLRLFLSCHQPLAEYKYVVTHTIASSCKNNALPTCEHTKMCLLGADLDSSNRPQYILLSCYATYQQLYNNPLSPHIDIAKYYRLCRANPRLAFSSGALCCHGKASPPFQSAGHGRKTTQNISPSHTRDERPRQRRH